MHLEKHLVFGYVFRREDFPWLMSWMNFTGDDRAARGMEFSTQTFDISHRETVAMSPLFGTPTFRWLPAKSKIETRFLMFYTRVPEGFSRIDNVTFENGKITILDHSGKSVTLGGLTGVVTWRRFSGTSAVHLVFPGTGILPEVRRQVAPCGGSVTSPGSPVNRPTSAGCKPARSDTILPHTPCRLRSREN